MTIAAVLKYRVLDTKIGDVVLPIYLANAAGSPVNGTSGTLAGVAPPGALLMTQEVALYQNTNTQASPTWSPLANDGAAAITAGTINGASIGQSTPAAGSFTQLSAQVAGSGNTIAAGTTSAQTPIVDTTSNVTTADATHIAAILPTGVQGDQRLVYNSGGASAQTISVYCQGTDTIDGGSAGGHVTLTVAHRAAWFYCVAANTWISALVSAVST